jgi:hypothetical protein
MKMLPRRTGSTWLTHEHLTLLDALFDVAGSFRLLRHESFSEQWNLGYSHGLDDPALRRQLRWLCQHGILIADGDDDSAVFRTTAAGGELWSAERCPVWERYCTERYSTTSKGRTIMTVCATSADIRDRFLDLWPVAPARRRTMTIPDRGLVGWHPFGRLFVGLACYTELLEWTSNEYESYKRHQAMVERERTWWRTIRELQRFIGESA